MNSSRQILDIEVSIHLCLPTVGRNFFSSLLDKGPEYLNIEFVLFIFHIDVKTSLGALSKNFVGI